MSSYCTSASREPPWRVLSGSKTRHVIHLPVVKKKGISRKDLDLFRAVHILNFLYKWYTQSPRILPFALVHIPQQQRGFIEGGNCGQALLGLPTVISRTEGERQPSWRFCSGWGRKSESATDTARHGTAPLAPYLKFDHF